MSNFARSFPSWINKEFLQTVITNRIKNGEESSIINFEVNPAAAPGDNYISDIYRVRVETRDEKVRSFVVKCVPVSGYNLKFIRNSCLFEKEILLYDSILPSMQTLCKNTYSLAPKCFSVRTNTVLILEDLLPLGYELMDRRLGLDLEHCCAALRFLARFHALSTGLNQEELEAKFPETVYGGTGKAHACSYVTNSVMSMADRVDKWPGFERFATKLRNIASSSTDQVLDLFSSTTPFRVLNHGDFWTNNIMFRHNNNGQIISVKLIDFQMCRYVSPVFDLLYFLYTSPQEEVRNNSEDILLEEYRKEFCDTCERANLPRRLSAVDLKKAMEENAFYGFINAILMLPAVLSGPEDTPDLANVAGGTSEMEWLSGRRFREQLQQILINFEKRGLI